MYAPTWPPPRTPNAHRRWRINFRSRPSLLAAIDALYAQAGYDVAFVTEGIAFHPVQPGTQRADADLLRDGALGPLLTLWQAPEPPPAKQA